MARIDNELSIPTDGLVVIRARGRAKKQTLFLAPLIE